MVHLLEAGVKRRPKETDERKRAIISISIYIYICIEL